MPLLSMRNIRKSFGGVAANDDVSIDVDSGEILALLGENGAGKTTLMNILFGLYAADSGSVLWKGRALGAHTPAMAMREGIGMVHQHFMLVPTLTVSENITLGLKTGGYPFTRRSELDARIRDIACAYGLDIDPGVKVEELSVGEQQRVEIMKLLYRGAELLILDEPTAVLTPGEAEQLFAVLGRLKEEGHAVILITHRIPEVLKAADAIAVLRGGTVAGKLRTSDATPEVLSRLMIGRSMEELDRASTRPPEAPVSGGIAVEGLGLGEAGRERLRGASLRVRPGEIVGIAGVDGNGQRELAECILGLRRPRSGTISLGGRRVERMGVAERRALGLGFVSEDRHGDGLALEMSLAENLMLGSSTLRAYSRGAFVSRAAVRRAAEAAIAEYAIVAPGPSAPVRLLSGGNQQKLILARELGGSPKFIVASQPTRGLDLGAARFVHERLLEHRRRGAAILLVSADLDEIFALSDRIVAIHGGRVSDYFENGPELDMTRLGLFMAGHGGEDRG